MNKDQIKLKWWFLNNKTSVSVRFKVSLLSHYRITEGWLTVYHLESTPEKQKNLCRIEEYFQDFFFSFALKLTLSLIVYLRNSRWFICFQMETLERGGRRVQSTNSACSTLHKTEAELVHLKTLICFYPTTACIKVKSARPAHQRAQVTVCLVTENTTFKPNLTSCDF